MTGSSRWRSHGRGLAAAAALLLAAALAVTSLWGDSATFDETAHLVSGFSYLATGDFRLAPDHPPLLRMLAASPAWLAGVAWPEAGPGWSYGDYWALGRFWLFQANDPDRVLLPGRLVVVGLLLLLLALIGAAGRALAGPSAGLLALWLAALDPTLLAHGRLVTTDLIAALAMLGAVLAWARLLERTDASRLAAAAVAAAVLPLGKLSWPLTAPALLAVTAHHVAGRSPLGAETWARARRAATLLLGLALTAYVAVWASYGFRYSMVVGPDADRVSLLVPHRPGDAPPASLEETWRSLLAGRDGAPAGRVQRAVEAARRTRLLPEAYLFVVAYNAKANQERSSYFFGQYSTRGTLGYFPFLLLVKTPLPTLLLCLVGLAALWRHPPPDATARSLLAGLLTLAITVAIAASFSDLQIGHRHLLPLYPPLLACAGAAATLAPAGRFSRRPLRVAALVWLLAANLWIHPHYLSYFNELIGGPARAHHYVLDSNIDWGQDLLRLAAWRRRHPEGVLHLAYFGSADPRAYAIQANQLLDSFPSAAPAELETGYYVVSLTQLYGVYEIFARDSFWARAENVAGYRRLLAGPGEDGRRRTLERLRAGRLLQQLRRRTADDRIGWSLLVFRLTAAEAARLAAPPE